MVERDALRHTPAGVAILDFRISHVSEQIEAGQPRKVELELACMAVEQQARMLSAAALGIGLRLGGFMTPRGRNGRQLMLHIDEIEFRN